MIVCQCNVLSDKEIEGIIWQFLEDDCWTLVVPGRIFNAAKKLGRCCGCFPNIVETIIKVTEAYHLAHVRDEEKVVDFLDRVRALRTKFGSMEYHERRRKSYRAA
ncbi:MULTISPECIES: (2Fe-2S)-binding protein [unclassified Bartonella]|uniref:(2Fe-2S)-binding protein n=1 Tax=unclassified Bartonella TaxID=2645622 RepID=UPI0029057010|nr:MULTISPECIES: (2Fe-2S)-binding protein [unclassified Bartonella]